MKKLLLTLTSLSVLALSTASLADGLNSSTGPTAASGFYLTTGIGYGKTDIKNAPTNVEDSGVTWLGGAGYQFNSNIAVEGGYLSMAHIKYDGVSVRPHALYLAGKGILPVNQKLDVFAKAGVADASVDAKYGDYTFSPNTNKLVPLVGIGTDYYLTNSLAVTVQGLATLKTDEFPATYMATTGLSYKFTM